MARPVLPVNLSPGQQTILAGFVKSGQTPQWLYQRSQIILMAAQFVSYWLINLAPAARPGSPLNKSAGSLRWLVKNRHRS